MINPAKVQLNYSRNAHWQVMFQWADQRTGTGFDFTGSTYSMAIKSGGTTHASIGDGIAIDDSEQDEGNLTITIDKEKLPVGTHEFDLLRNDGSLDEKLLFGPVVADEGVTD